MLCQPDLRGGTGELVDELENRGVELHVARLTETVAETLRDSGLFDELQGRVHVELDLAIEAARQSEGARAE